MRRRRRGICTDVVINLEALYLMRELGAERGDRWMRKRSFALVKVKEIVTEGAEEQEIE